ncbi:IclR family transcriptional regulator, partial [Herbaspirillum sp. 3C11]
MTKKTDGAEIKTRAKPAKRATAVVAADTDEAGVAAPATDNTGINSPLY